MNTPKHRLCTTIKTIQQLIDHQDNLLGKTKIQSLKIQDQVDSLNWDNKDTCKLFYYTLATFEGNMEIRIQSCDVFKDDAGDVQLVEPIYIL